jgi:hypothetical protein
LGTGILETVRGSQTLILAIERHPLHAIGVLTAKIAKHSSLFGLLSLAHGGPLSIL